jgi:uncharacterized protein YbjT (DUF2867 family)
MMVLVLGGSGDLGAPVAQQLRGDGFQVRLLIGKQVTVKRW